MIDTAVRMRDDLVGHYRVPAWRKLDEDAVYLDADELKGARYLPDLCSDDDEEYEYTRVQLKDGRIFLMIGVDLDFGGEV